MYISRGVLTFQYLYFFLIFFFDFLSFEGVFGAAGTLDPPSLNRVKFGIIEEPQGSIVHVPVKLYIGGDVIFTTMENKMMFGRIDELVIFYIET